MFMIIRLTIGCVFLALSIMAIAKSRAIHKRLLYIISTSVSVTLILVLAFLPFENLFISFNSAKDAYEYYVLGKSSIELVVEGDGCDLVVDRKNDSDTYLIIPKTSHGWKVGIGSNTKRRVQKITDGIVIYVYQYKNTNDFFVTVLDTNGGDTSVSDDNNTHFFSLEKKNDSLGISFITYYGHISSLDTQYSIEVNGNKVSLGEL